MWAEYLKERSGKEVLQDPNGFTVYSYPGEGLCYIEDNWVMPAFRKSGVAKKMADKVVLEAKERNCHTLIGSVDLKSKAPGMNMKVLLAYGMDPYLAEGSVVYFRKDI